jgi:hypothetical protein
MQGEKLFCVYMVADRSRVLTVASPVIFICGLASIAVGLSKASSAAMGATGWFGLSVTARHLQLLFGSSRSNDGVGKRKFLIELENPTWEDLLKDWGWRLNFIRGIEKEQATVLRLDEGTGREAGFSAALLTMRL